MFRSYFKTALRNLQKNKTLSFINIAGLSIGMTVALLIGLWIWDEFSFDKYHQNYARIARVMQQETYNGYVSTGEAIPLPLEAEIRKNYGRDFRHIVMTAWTSNHVLITADKEVTFSGNFISSEGPEMLTLHMIRGTRNGLKGPSSILISRSVATALFGEADPMGQLIKLDNNAAFTVAGVYEDLPLNTTFHNLAFMAPWDYFVSSTGWVKKAATDWNDDSFQMFAQIAGNEDMARVSEKIKDCKLHNVDREKARFRPTIILQPMSKWHLYSDFRNGINTGGAIQYVWLFGIIGMFVLLLACINFMNLSTARSEKRAKEVGIRKSLGSLRAQLISQFFCESMLMAILAFAFSLLLAALVVPFFNEIADKKMTILWGSPAFWLACAGFTLFTGSIAGSYPALYLSSFKAVKVLKGTFKAGWLATSPRKALVVLQFTVSVVLIIGTIIVFKQVQFARNRPVGYSRDGLIVIEESNDELHDRFNAVRTGLLSTGAVTEAAESSSPTTGVENGRSGLIWKGKDPAMTDHFGNIRVTTGYGTTVGWQFVAGRDFSSQYLTDSFALVLNEAAVRYMHLQNPIGETIRGIGKKDFHVIGVVKDMVMESPFQQVKPTIFYISESGFAYVNIRINPNVSTREALQKIAAVCKTYSPSVPFSYKFADEEYARKFRTEERIGQLAGIFASLAVFISCLGLFGMATFMAEQRIKEIGVRKVLGATVFNLWGLLSKDFITLVGISLLIAIPIAYYCMDKWLQHYAYRSGMPWWVFASAGAGALLITLLTVSYQSIKAALTNPVNSLRSE
ncbi:ABC transporter permease [Flavitalea sp. BT771]|uniref:ABC transporter permease n=1 Tax=Flavitalea sp. BT771 TaxID=3063329 RepID=UPI0026E29E4E|nr:ABC transporter permease [Flavitalea sp. BT771]MDO6433335.1 ABC transporter permease [Flavitalea sp. BT771]MDV6222760.1 ABC transporter permease [Flavitalea sp. BT771]